MKRLFFAISILHIQLLLCSCSTTAIVRNYSEQSTSNSTQNGIVFSLPKTLLQATITYSLYEKSSSGTSNRYNLEELIKDDKPSESGQKNRLIVTVEKPILVTTIKIPDPSMRFIFDTKSLDGFTKSTDTTLELTSDGLIKSSNVIALDKSKEIILNTTGSIISIGKIFVSPAQILLGGIKSDKKEYVFIQDINATRIIDPSELIYTYSQGKYIAIYDDIYKAKSIFKSIETVPSVRIKFEGERDISKIIPVKLDSTTGIPYRAPSPLRVNISVDDCEIYDQFHMFAQAGVIASIPVNAKAFSDLTQGITFSDDGAYLSKFASKGTSVGESVSSIAEETTSAINAGMNEIDQAKIKKLENQKALIDAELALEQSKMLLKEFKQSQE